MSYFSAGLSMMSILMNGIGLFILIFSSLSYSQNKLATCTSMASKMNQSLPAKIDRITTLQTTSCLEDKGEIYFQYVHIISNASALPRDVQAKARSSARTQYCGNSEFRNALNLYNFDFYYVDSMRHPLYSFTLKSSDC